MSISLNFTKESITKIETPKSGAVTYRDTKERGLILIAGYGGTKVFYLYKSIDGRPTKIKIAPFPDFSVLEAREKAVELKNLIAKGINPAKEKRHLRGELTFKMLLDKYVNEHLKLKNPDKDRKPFMDEMDRHAKPLYNCKISTISRDDIQQIYNGIPDKVVKRHQKVTGKVAANRFLGKMRAIFNKAIDWELLARNPAKGITEHKEYKRERYISGEEAPQFLEAIQKEDNQDVGDYILLSLYTGARKNALLSMRWEDINLTEGTWHISAIKSKNGKAQLVSLYIAAVEILKKRRQHTTGEFVFPSPRSKSGHLKNPMKTWNKVLKRSELKDLCPHDLRRTFASWLRQEGADTKIICKALNNFTAVDIYAYLDNRNVKTAIDRTFDNRINGNLPNCTQEQKERLIS